MKHRKIKIFSMFSALLLLASCGGNNQSSDTETSGRFEVEKDTVEERSATVALLGSLPIEGEHADYFKATNLEGTESINLVGTPDDNQGVIRAEVLLTVLKRFPNLDGFAVFPPLTLYFLNEDKEEISHARLQLSKADQEAVLSELKKSKPGKVTLNYKGEFYPSTYNEIFDKVKYVQIHSASLSDGSSSSGSSSSYYSSDDDSDYSSDDDSDESMTSSSSSNNWDSILDDYEKSVMKLASVAKKASNGDPTALTEYASASAECVSLMDRLNSEKSTMTTAQQARLVRIIAKYNKAISSM